MFVLLFLLYLVVFKVRFIVNVDLLIVGLVVKIISFFGWSLFVYLFNVV